MVIIRLIASTVLDVLLVLGILHWVGDRRWSWTDQILAGLLGISWLIVAMEIGLGLVRFLRQEIIILSVIFVGGALIAYRWQATIEVSRGVFKGLLASWHSLGWVDRLVWIVLGLAGSWTVICIIWLPTIDWDGQWYHLPIAFSRFQWGDLRPIPSYPPYFITGYPEVGELIILWRSLEIGHAALSDGASFVFWVMGIIAIYSLGRKLGFNAGASWWGGLMWALAPIVWLQARTAHVDLMVASLFLAGLNFAFHNQMSWKTTALVAASVGLLIGIKYGALVYGGMLCLLWLWRTFFSQRRRISLLKWLGILGLWLIGSAAGWFWYIRNAYYFGNPVWPLEMSLGPFVIYGPMTLAWQDGNMHTPPEIIGMPKWRQWWPIWLELNNHYFYAASANGFGPQWWILGLPGILFWLLRSADKRRWQIIGLSLLILLLSPWSWHTRYVMFLPAVGSLGVAAVLSFARRWTSILTRVLILLAVTYVALTSFDSPVWVGEVKRQAFLPFEWRRATFIAPMDGVFRWLDQNTRDSTKVGYGDGLGLIGIIWGEDLRHQVLYIGPKDMGEADIKFLIAPIGSPQDQIASQSPWYILVAEDTRSVYHTLRLRLYYHLER